MHRFLALCALACAIGCAGDPIPLTTCTAGVQTACACPGGAVGAQRCAADGSGFGECSCPDASTVLDAVAVDADAATDALADAHDAAPADTTVPGDAVDAAADASNTPDVTDVTDAADSSCPPGYADCDGNPANGCEVDTRTNTNHCAACRHACLLTATATARCAASRCEVVTCLAGYADCNHDPGDGCETDFSAPGSCGVCGMTCAARPNATARCADLRCSYACVDGWADCDGLAANGCEAHVARCP